MASGGGMSGPPPGPPYAPTHQALGEQPSLLPDVPVNAVFLALFIGAAVGHMATFQINRKRGKKFVLNAATFGFCMTRIIATSLRIAWSLHPHNVSLGMASTIFVYAGIPILFIANLFFAQRIVRAQHPAVGWSKPFSIWLPLLIAVMIATIFCLIAAVIVLFYYPPSATFQQTAARDIQLYGQTLFACCAFLPLPILAVSCLARAHPKVRMTKTMDKFGSGSMRAKIVISVVSAIILTLGAAYRTGTAYLPPTPNTAPKPWYFSKACFYVFNFTLEIGVVYAWLALRIDKRYFVPDGAKGPFSYAGGFVFAGEPGNEKAQPQLAADENDSDDVSSAPRRGRRSGSVPRVRSSRTSLALISTPHSRARSESRVSWGGIPRSSLQPSYGEDGVELPYGHFSGGDDALPYESERPANDSGASAEELGWDERTGRWALRPISEARKSSPTEVV